MSTLLAIRSDETSVHLLSSNTRFHLGELGVFPGQAARIRRELYAPFRYLFFSLPLMFLNTNVDPRDHSSCSLFYDEAEHWLCATWRGYIDPVEAMHGAEAYLAHAAHTPSALLLNDNSQLTGPWFESTDWLVHVWLPQAQRLGLRYVAHVVQADQHYDIITMLKPKALPFDLQIFDELPQAQHWLRECRVALAQPR